MALTALLLSIGAIVVCMALAIRSKNVRKDNIKEDMTDKIVLKDIVGGFNLEEINSNFNKIETALNEKVLYRTNPTGESNVMNQTLDMNGYGIINLGTINSGGVPVPAPVLAEDVVFNPIGSISSTNVQDAIEELMNEGGGTSAGVESFNTRTGAVTLVSGDVTGALGFTPPPTNNPTLTGTVTIPTPSPGDNSTKAASTAFVTSAIAAAGLGGGTFINVLDYGAIGDGVTNNDIAFTNAINAAKASVGRSLYIPPGKYIKSISHDVTELDVWGDPMQFGELGSAQIVQTTNQPVFTVVNSHGFGMHYISITGANNPAFTNNIGLKITDSSNVRVHNCDFYYLYDSIQQLGECFYGQYSHLRGYNHGNCFFNGIGNTAPGFDSHFNDCIITSTTGVYGFKFTQAGSVTLDTCIITPNGMSGASCFFDSDASLAGVHQISNCVFESGQVGLYLKGTPGQKIKFVQISNTYIASPANDAMRVDYGHATLSTCYFTSQNYAVKIYNQGNVIMSNCDYQVLGPPLTADTGATEVEYSSTNSVYQGGFQFVYLPFLDNVKVKRVDILGGDVGIHATPADLPANTAGVRWAKGIGLSSTAGVSAFNTRTGTVTLLPTDIVSALSSISTELNVPSTIRATNKILPTTGQGMEILYDTAGAGTGYLVSYDRGLNQYKPMSIDAEAITFKSGAAVIDGTGNLLVNYLTSQGIYKLQVNGNALINGEAYASTPATSTTGTRVATCDYVINKIAAGGVTSYNGRTGAVTAISSDVTNAIGYTPANNSSPSTTGLSTSAGGYRATGLVTPGAGAGLEMQYDTGTGTSYVVSYNRSGSVYRPMSIDASAITFNSGNMVLDGSGRLLIGFLTSQGAAYKLQVNSQIFATNATIATSDKRYKENITELKDGLNIISKLKPVVFDFKKHDVLNFSEHRQVGFLAQDVEEVLEDTDYVKSVVATTETDMKGIADTKLIPLLVKAIQELKAEIEELKKK